MVLIALPTKEIGKEELHLAESILDALKPDYVISDGVSPWSRTMAYATFNFNIRLRIAQPWRRNLDPEISKRADSISVFDIAPANFFLDKSRYFDWVNSNCTHASVLKGLDSYSTHMYRVYLKGVKIYEHER